MPKTLKNNEFAPPVGGGNPDVPTQAPTKPRESPHYHPDTEEAGAGLLDCRVYCPGTAELWSNPHAFRALRLKRMEATTLHAHFIPRQIGAQSLSAQSSFGGPNDLDSIVFARNLPIWAHI